MYIGTLRECVFCYIPIAVWCYFCALFVCLPVYTLYTSEFELEMEIKVNRNMDNGKKYHFLIHRMDWIKCGLSAATPHSSHIQSYSSTMLCDNGEVLLVRKT